MTDHKDTIIKALEIMKKSDASKISKENKTAMFKVRAYGKVITQLKAIDGPITKFEDVASIKGMGEKIQLKIKEILESGKLSAAEQIVAKGEIDSFEVLSNVHGIGPVKARELMKAGIKTIADLRAAVTANPDLLNDTQKLGLKYYEDGIERIPRSEMERHEKMIMSEIEAPFEAVIVGSYRRGAAESGDIDVLMTLPDSMPAKEQKVLFAAVVEQMKKRNYIIDTLAQGDKKFLGYVRAGEGMRARRLDLLMTPQKEFAYAILYFTGSANFNIAFRAYVLAKGYTINEHRMTPAKGHESLPEPPPMKTERDIFQWLGLKYVAPDKRVGAADVQVLSPPRARDNSNEESKSNRERSRAASNNEESKSNRERSRSKSRTPPPIAATATKKKKRVFKVVKSQLPVTTEKTGTE
jgi:DNA polymerase/3'-5' exonuclease PolX